MLDCPREHWKFASCLYKLAIPGIARPSLESVRFYTISL